MLIHLLSPNFSPHGSNQKIFENEICKFMMKYIRETAAGRVPFITLESKLQFVARCDNEPVPGFSFNPTITFTPVHTFKSKWALNQQHIFVATLWNFQLELQLLIYHQKMIFLMFTALHLLMLILENVDTWF